MGHSNKEQWQKDLSNALESFTSDWETQVKETRIQSVTSWKLFNSSKRHKETSSKGGKIQGEINAKNGHMREVQKLSPKKFSKKAIRNAAKASKIRMSSEEGREIQSKGGKVAGPIAQSKFHYCENCEEDIKGTIYYRHHGEKCQLKGIEKQDVIDMYNQPKMSIDKVAKHFGISRNIVFKLVKKS